jgi:hypothetical protein
MPFASTGVPAPLTLDFVVTPAARVAGAAMLTDGRALSGATVEALPLACPVLSLDGGAVPKDSPRCLPRSAQTVTDIDGSYGMPLDNGTYLLRVEPAAGTRLPWVWQTIVVSGPQSVNFLVPAPAQIGLALLALPTSSTASVRLADYAVADAIVRLFVPPAPGSPAIEAARTITDATGRFDFYFDPSIR